MALTPPYKQHNYMGEYLNDADALAFIVGCDWHIVGVPNTPQEGMTYQNTTTHKMMVYNGTAWEVSGGVPDHNDTTNKQGGQAAEYFHMKSAEHVAITGSGGVVDAGGYHLHDARYYTEAEINSAAPGTEGASLVGTEAKPNLANADTVEEALDELNTRNPPKRGTNAGNPNTVVVGSPGDICNDTTNSIPYMKITGAATNTGWGVI